jgi:aryl-alcohol dehydrogenase-like predicted oxidoreductase
VATCPKALDCADPGTTKLRRLQENLGSAEVELSAADLSAIRAALDTTGVTGDRYNAHAQERINR